MFHLGFPEPMRFLVTIMVTLQLCGWRWYVRAKENILQELEKEAFSQGLN